MTRLVVVVVAIAAIALAATGCSSEFGTASESDAAPDAGEDAARDAGGPFHREPDLDTMTRIATSTFSMGHPVEPPGPYGQPWKENELPAHDVTLSEYYVDRDEVTVEAYAEFLEEAGGPVHWHPLQPIHRDGGGYEPAPGAASRPIALVSWYDAATFCAWAGKRLPTEAEWERAARGPEGFTFPWGDDAPDCDHAVYFTGSARCEESPQDVGSRSPLGDSAEGCRDMAGNVAEWVGDFDGRYPSEAQEDPTGPETGRYRVVRGGGFHESTNAQRSTTRWPADPSDRSVGVGFRCALRP